MRDKVRRWIVLGLMILPVLAFITLEVKEYKLEQHVEGYLIEQKGYEMNDIQKIVTDSKKFAVEAMVVFVDEPQIQYLYQIKDGEVTQRGYGVVQGFQKSLDQDHLVHLE